MFFSQVQLPALIPSIPTLIMISFSWVRLKRRRTMTPIVSSRRWTVWQSLFHMPWTTVTPLKARMWRSGAAMTILEWADTRRFWKLPSKFPVKVVVKFILACIKVPLLLKFLKCIYMTNSLAAWELNHGWIWVTCTSLDSTFLVQVDVSLVRIPHSVSCVAGKAPTIHRWFSIQIFCIQIRNLEIWLLCGTQLSLSF